MLTFSIEKYTLGKGGSCSLVYTFVLRFGVIIIVVVVVVVNCFTFYPKYP